MPTGREPGLAVSLQVLPILSGGYAKLAFELFAEVCGGEAHGLCNAAYGGVGLLPEQKNGILCPLSSDARAGYLSKLLLFAQQTAQQAHGRAQEATAGATLERKQDVVDVHVTVAVLVFDETGKLADDTGNKAAESRSQGTQIQFAQDVFVEQVSGQGGDTAIGCIGLAGEQFLDLVQAASLCCRLFQGTQDGVREAAQHLLFKVGRDVYISGGCSHSLLDEIADVCHIS